MTATETACEPHVRRHALRWRGHAWAAALLGWVLGTALQVQQPVLWAAGVYIGVTVFAFALTLLARAPGRVRRALSAGCWPPRWPPSARPAGAPP